MERIVAIIQQFETLLTQGQDTALLHYSLGNAYFQQENLPKALEHLERAVTLDPEYSAAWKGYGKALASHGQIQAAIDAYTQGIAVANHKGDRQAAKEMTVFLKRLQNALDKKVTSH